MRSRTLGGEAASAPAAACVAAARGTRLAKSSRRAIFRRWAITPRSSTCTWPACQGSGSASNAADAAASGPPGRAAAAAAAGAEGPASAFARWLAPLPVPAPAVLPAAPLLQGAALPPLEVVQMSATVAPAARSSSGTATSTSASSAPPPAYTLVRAATEAATMTGRRGRWPNGGTLPTAGLAWQGGGGKCEPQHGHGGDGAKHETTCSQGKECVPLACRHSALTGVPAQLHQAAGGRQAQPVAAAVQQRGQAPLVHARRQRQHQHHGCAANKVDQGLDLHAAGRRRRVVQRRHDAGDDAVLRQVAPQVSGAQRCASVAV